MRARTIVAIVTVGVLSTAGLGSAGDRAVRRGGGRGGWSGGGRPAGGHSGRPVTAAQARHPRAGTGYYSHGYGYGYRGYSKGGYGHGYRPYYGYKPYYGYRPYYGYYGYRPYYRPYYGYGYGYPYYASPYYAYGYGGGPYLSVGFGYASGGASVGVGYATSPAPAVAYAPGYAVEAAEPVATIEAREQARSDYGTLQIDVQPEDASVYVDDQFRGTAADARRLRLRPGRHRLEIVRPGYRTHQDEVVVEPGVRVVVDVILDRN
jgi:hypothetical protein